MMWPPTLPKRPCGRPHMCMKIAFRTLIGGASSMTNSLIFSVDLRHENECQEMAFSRQPCDVRFGSKADICAAKSHVRFTPKSGHQSVQATRLRRGIAMLLF